MSPDGLTHGPNVSRETRKRLEAYIALLKKWQAKTNLISPATLNDIWQRHVKDSLQLASLIDPKHHIVDLGSGGGFPGLVLAAHFAEMEGGRISLIETNGKKCAFLREAVRCLDLPASVSVAVINDRVENALPLIQEPILLTARAFTSLDSLMSYALLPQMPVIKCLFPKGARHEEEISTARLGYHFDCLKHNSALEQGSVILECSNIVVRKDEEI